MLGEKGVVDVAEGANTRLVELARERGETRRNWLVLDWLVGLARWEKSTMLKSLFSDWSKAAEGSSGHKTEVVVVNELRVPGV